jgi:hypothetical protein
MSKMKETRLWLIRTSSINVKLASQLKIWFNIRLKKNRRKSFSVVVHKSRRIIKKLQKKKDNKY